MLRQNHRLKLVPISSQGKASGKSAHRLTLASQAEPAETGVEGRRAIAVFSRDESVINIIAEGMSDSWIVEKFTDPHEGHEFLLKPHVRIVVIDDEAIEESTRGWLLGQVRKHALHALVAYIAAIHSPETERQARAYSVQYYTSKPMDRERTLRVLHSFEHAVH
jgi:DNA-binding NtrC family response regulator